MQRAKDRGAEGSYKPPMSSPGDDVIVKGNNSLELSEDGSLPRARKHSQQAVETAGLRSFWDLFFLRTSLI
jgi:hypothetical protein